MHFRSCKQCGEQQRVNSPLGNTHSTVDIRCVVRGPEISTKWCNVPIILRSYTVTVVRFA